MSISNCFFLTCIQVLQEADKVVWYSHLFKNFPQFIVIQAIKGFSILSEAEVDIFFWNFLAYSMNQHTLAIWSLVPLPFLKPACTSASSWFIMLKCSLKYFEHYLVSMWNDGSQSVSSVAQLCPTLYNPMNHSTSGLPVHHQLPEFTQTHIHWVGDAIQPSHPLSSPSPPVLSLSQDQGLFKWVSPLHQVAKYWHFSFNISPSNVVYTYYIYIC